MYIGSNVRPRLDKEIEALAQAISKCVVLSSAEYSLASTSGYAVAKLFTRLLALKGNGVTQPGIATVLGTLETVKQEFHRKVAAPFEERQRNANGEVFSELL